MHPKRGTFIIAHKKSRVKGQNAILKEKNQKDRTPKCPILNRSSYLIISPGETECNQKLQEAYPV